MLTMNEAGTNHGGWLTGSGEVEGDVVVWKSSNLTPVSEPEGARAGAFREQSALRLTAQNRLRCGGRTR